MAMLCDALSDAMGLARIRLQSIVASLRRKTSILFQIKQNDIGAPSLGGFVLLWILILLLNLVLVLLALLVDLVLVL